MKRSHFQMRRLSPIGLVVLLAASGCQSSTNTLGDSGATAIPGCVWSASFDSADAALGQCVAARVYLSCKGSNGDGMTCMSNDPAGCPEPNPIQGVTFSDCENQCSPDEYALGCGGVGPGPWPQPPSTCRMLPAGPGGGTVSCCPCGT